MMNLGDTICIIIITSNNILNESMGTQRDGTLAGSPLAAVRCQQLVGSKRFKFYKVSFSQGERSLFVI